MSDAQLVLDLIFLFYQDSRLGVWAPFLKATILAAKVQAELSAFYFDSYAETTLQLFVSIRLHFLYFKIIVC